MKRNDFYFYRSNNENFPNGEYEFHSMFAQDKANELFKTLLNETPWKQDEITIYNKKIPLPRLQQWYGDSEAIYSYSGINLKPLPWTKTLLQIKEFIEESFNFEKTFNSVLLNLYRNGNDYVGFHSDNEPELGENPTIASLSLGAERDFILKHNDPSIKPISFNLKNGSLFIMSGTTQTYYKHSLSKRKKILEPRINLTFRNIIK